MKNVRSKFNLNNSGVALTTVLIMLLVMSIIISAVVFLTVGNLNKSKKTVDHFESYYVAEGGINYLTKLIETQYGIAPTTSSTAFFSNLDAYAATFPVSNKQAVSFSSNGGKTSQALVWITALTVTDPNVHSYKIYSSGYIGSIYRTLSKQIDISYVSGGFYFKNAILAADPSGTIEVGGAYIDGTIQTLSHEDNAITFRGGYVDGIYIPAGSTPTKVVSCPSGYTNCIPGLGTTGITYPEKSTTVKSVTILPTPTVSTLLKPYTFGSGSTSYPLIDSSGNFSITSSSNLSTPTVYNLGDLNPGVSVFNVPNFKVTQLAPNFTLEINRDITIVTNTLWLNNQFKVTGSGKLTIYVRSYASVNSTNDRIQVSSNDIVGNVSDPTKMTIYVAPLTIKSGSNNVPALLTLGSGSYSLSLLSSNLNFDLGNSVLKGALATNVSSENAIKINNDGPANVFIGPSSSASAVLLYAPNGIVHMKSSSSAFYGAIISGSFTSSTGNSHPYIYYRDINSYIPDVIDLTGFNSPPTTAIIKNATTE